MTITTNPSRDEYTSGPGQTVFNYTFKIYANNELDVYVTPAGQQADDATDLTTDYVVDPVTIGNESGGFITFNTPLNNGDLVTIVSGIDYDRTVDYQVNGDFIPATVNTDNDRQVSQIKQVLEFAKKAVVFGQAQQGTSGLTSEAPEAGKFIRWKGDLSGFENSDLTDIGSLVPVSSIDVIYPTVALMKADALNVLNVGVTVSTQGYYSVGDGGGATYLIVPAQSVDGLGDHTLDSGDVALLQSEREINLKQYGCVGDGVTNDTTALQAALDRILSSGDSLFVPNGEYILNPITYKPSSDQKPVTIRGEGMLRPGEPENNLASSRTRGVIFHFSTIAGTSVAFDIGDGVSNPQGIYIENIYILGQTSQDTASPTDDTIGLRLSNCPESYFKNVNCSRFNQAWRMSNSWSTSLYNCSGGRCFKGISFGLSSNAVKLYSWRSQRAFWSAELSSSSAGLSFYGPWFENCTNGVIINNGTEVVNALLISNPHFELITNYCLELGYDLAGSQTTGNIQSVNLMGGYFDSVGSGVSGSKVRISDNTSRDVIIYGEPGNFDVSQIDNNMDPVKVVRSEKTDQSNQGGPFLQEFFGYKSGVADNSATDILTITVPPGDCNFSVELICNGQTNSGSYAAVTKGVISCGRKASEANCYATYSESVAKVASDNGSGASYAGVFALSITTATNVITVRLTADNNQSQTTQAMTYVRSFGSERSQAAVRKLTFADA